TGPARARTDPCHEVPARLAEQPSKSRGKNDPSSACGDRSGLVWPRVAAERGHERTGSSDRVGSQLYGRRRLLLRYGFGLEASLLRVFRVPQLLREYFEGLGCDRERIGESRGCIPLG